jgi:hypothetical protein
VIKLQKVRRPLSAAQKLGIIERTEHGEYNRDICTAMNLSSSTVRAILSPIEKPKEDAESSVSGTKLEQKHKLKMLLCKN